MKVLIYNRDLQLKEIGGPSGYLYNIYNYLESNPCDIISFYSKEFDIIPTLSQRIISKVEYICMHYTKRCKLLHFMFYLFFNYFVRYPLSKKEISKVNTYDFVHIHVVFTYLRYFYKRKISAKTILTSHNPEPLIDEVSALFGYQKWFANHTKVRNFFIRRELLAYKQCDKIMFPVKDAKEPYINASELYNNCFRDLDEKFFYVVTAVNDLNRIEDKKNYLYEFNIPSSALKLCYVGRHTEVKGYDQLKLMAREVWHNYPDTYFIIGGREEPLLGLDDKRWIELGWVDTCSLLNEVDVFVLPNKNTYFDLILIEVLRQGNVVMLTNTGGNKWFDNRSLEGLKFYTYGDVKQFLTKLSECITLKRENKIHYIMEKNRSFFCKEFNMSNYIEKYVECLSSFKD